MRLARASGLFSIATVGLLGLGFVVLPGKTLLVLEALSLLDPLPNLSPSETAYLHFVYGVLGAVMWGWMVGFGLMLHVRPLPLPRVALISLVAWFVPDTALSLWTGYSSNVLLNIVALLIVAVPLLILAKGGDSEDRAGRRIAE